MSPHYLNEVFIKASESSSSLRSSYQKLQQPFQKACTGRNAFHQVSEEIKGTTNLNTFKHNLKKRYSKKINDIFLKKSYCY